MPRRSSAPPTCLPTPVATPSPERARSASPPPWEGTYVPNLGLSTGLVLPALRLLAPPIPPSAPAVPSGWVRRRGWCKRCLTFAYRLGVEPGYSARAD